MSRLYATLKMIHVRSMFPVLPFLNEFNMFFNLTCQGYMLHLKMIHVRSLRACSFVKTKGIGGD